MAMLIVSNKTFEIKPSRADRLVADALVGRLLRSEPEAWDRFAKVYTPVVDRWARAAGLQPSDVADVTQEVFGTVARKLTTFRRDKNRRSFEVWLWAITRNVLRQFFQIVENQPEPVGGVRAIGRMVQQTITTFDSENDFEEPMTNRVEEAIRAIRNDFQDNTWQAFWRMTINQETASAIAEDLNMNARAVRQAKFRVLTRLKDELSAYVRQS